MHLAKPKVRNLMLPGSLMVVLGSVLPLGTEAAENDEFAGQRVVHLLQEPRHRTVHRDGDLVLLDVQLNAGDTSLPHVHDSAILVTTISTAEGAVYGRVSSNIDYASTPFTHAISNAGPGMLRIIAMTNLGAGEPAVVAGRPRGLQGEPVIENQWFRTYRVALQPGTETPMLLLDNPSVVVQVTEGKLHVSRGDGITAELDAMAKWAWREANSAYKVQNVGDAPVEFLISEGRR